MACIGELAWQLSKADTSAIGGCSHRAAGFLRGTIPVSHGGFIGGGQIGYNWQAGPSWVWGIEADFQGTTVNGGAGAVSLSKPFGSITTVYKYELDDLGTVRARLGWLSSPNLLWYGTGGLAYGQTKLSTSAQLVLCPSRMRAPRGSHRTICPWVGRSVRALSGNLLPSGA